MTNDDPKLTAYALNELEGSDRAQVEAFLATSEPARRFVEEIRRTVAFLTQGLQSVQTPTLTSSQKREIATATSSPQSLYYANANRRRPRAWALWALATAACAAIVSAGIWRFSYRYNSQSHPSIAAMVDHNQSPKVASQQSTQRVGILPDLTITDFLKTDFQSGNADHLNYSFLDHDQAVKPSFFETSTLEAGLKQNLPNGAQTQLHFGAPRTFTEEQTLNGAMTGGDVNTSSGTIAESQLRLSTGGAGNIDAFTTHGFQLEAPQKIGGKTVATADNPFVGTQRDNIYIYATSGTDRKWASDSELLPITGWDETQLQHAATAPNESYVPIHDNTFQSVAEQPLSTFSIDVDTASYSNIRRFLNDGQLPPPDAVRIEEMLNYFPYNYETPKPDSKDPFAATVEIAGCPWNSAHRLARVAIKGREIAHDKRPVSNLVFLIDVSGSMNEPMRLPLVKEGLKLMVNELTENDRISIVVYAGNAGLVLPSTTADPINKQTILNAIENLSAGGSTNGGQGIELAYKIAAENFIKGGTNRVLLATDGDWNVGVTDQSSLINLIQDKAKSGVFLSVLGYGFGNLKDSTMEKLADKGNGHYAYIDGIKESKKVLVEEMSSTLVTIAKDVKIQIEFNPSKVESYRLLGYEKRLLRKEDFNNDKVDAGEIGAGHCVTALYEIIPGSKPNTAAPAEADVDPLKYQKHAIVKSDDLMTLKLRYKQPDGDKSTKLEFPTADRGIAYSKASEDFKFSAAVAQFGMILRNSPHKGNATLDGVLELADEGKGKDEKGYRAEFLEMVKKTKALSK